MWRPIEGFGGAFADCGCGCSGFGAAPGRRYPAIEQTLRTYIAGKRAAGQYYWISPQLNTAADRQATFGDAPGDGGASASWSYGPTADQFSSDTGSGSTSSPGPFINLPDPVAAAATSIGNFFSNLWGNTPPASSGVTMDPNGVTGSWDYTVSGPASTSAPIVNSLPSDLKPQVAGAAQSDLFGNPLSPWIIGGAAALLLVVGLASVASPRKSGRRR